MKQNILLSLLIVLAINFSGCGNESSQKVTYEKKNETLSLDTEPKSYRKYALVSSGNIEVKKTLSTDGPLADFDMRSNYFTIGTMTYIRAW